MKEKVNDNITYDQIKAVVLKRYISELNWQIKYEMLIKDNKYYF